MGWMLFFKSMLGFHPVRQIKNISFVLCAATLVLSGCSSRKVWHTSTLLYFDTVCEISFYATATEFRDAVQAVKKSFEKTERLFSPGTGDLSSPEVLYLYRKAKKIYLDSGGCFDITVAPLSSLWGFRDKHYRIPGRDEIRAVLPLIGMNKIHINKNGLNLVPGMNLDWGGIAKGYGVDQASAAAKEMGISRGFINAGGDLFCWGLNPDNHPWQIGIKHPRKNGYLGVLSLSDLAAATTGDYQRFFIKNGHRYHHVFDPKTGFPAQGKQSVTVIGPDALTCDALSTAVFVSKHPKKILLHFPDYGAIIFNDQSQLSIEGKKFPLKLNDS